MSMNWKEDEFWESMKWQEEHYSMRNYESKIREFIENKYGKEEVRKRLIEIKELAKYLSEKM